MNIINFSGGRTSAYMTKRLIEEGIEETDKLIITDKSQRVSKNKMTRYEFVRIIGPQIPQIFQNSLLYFIKIFN